VSVRSHVSEHVSKELPEQTAAHAIVGP